MNPALPLPWWPVAAAALRHNAMQERCSQQRLLPDRWATQQSRSVRCAAVLVHRCVSHCTH